MGGRIDVGEKENHPEIWYLLSCTNLIWYLKVHMVFGGDPAFPSGGHPRPVRGEGGRGLKSPRTPGGRVEDLTRRVMCTMYLSFIVLKDLTETFLA